MLVLTVEGRVLTADHMRAGLFIQPSEAALASSLLQGGAWLPPATPQASTDQPLGNHFLLLLFPRIFPSLIASPHLTSPSSLLMNTHAKKLWHQAKWQSFLMRV